QQSGSCIDEVRENFRWIFERPVEYLSINEETGKKVAKMTSELKQTLSQSLSSKSWPNKKDRSRAIESVMNIQFTSENLNKFHVFIEYELPIENELSKDNYFMNVYHSHKANYIQSMRKLALISDYGAIEKPAVVQYPEIYLAAVLLHPSFLNASHSVSEEYGILGWLIGRHLISNVFSDGQLDARLTCEPGNPSSIENQMCCLSRRDDNRTDDKQILQQLAANINGLMLSFSAYKKDIMKNSDDSLDEQKSFFEAIARFE
ncbi:unnamed protein product, partial [Schistosoma turkestanicum]